MVLVSPVAWEHYAVVLILPGVLLHMQLHSSSKARFVLEITLVVLAMPSEDLWEACGLRHWTDLAATPWNTLTALSLQLYAVLTLFFLGMIAARKADVPTLVLWKPDARPARQPEGRPTPVAAAA